MSGSDDEPRLPDDLEALGERLKRAGRGGTGTGREPDGAPVSGYAGAVRIGTEFLVAVCVGGGVGWALDQWLGTAPWLLVVFFLFGIATGVVNIVRLTTPGGGPKTR
ncbi:MAG: AtpZ/AtpI family protein [Alphaproteobacteria bacterium]|nr:AtpZ/AtpI family protein [Alphaproteobacteria bacterium]